MQWLASICVRRPVFATVLILIVVVVGIVGYSKLGVDRFPKVDFPVVVDRHHACRAPRPRRSRPRSPTRSKRRSTPSAASTSCARSRPRASRRSSSRFALEKNVDVAAQEVRDHVSTVLPDLPRGIEPPVVSKLDPDAAPVLFVGARVRRGRSREITELADQAGAPARSRTSPASAR